VERIIYNLSIADVDRMTGSGAQVLHFHTSICMGAKMLTFWRWFSGSLRRSLSHSTSSWGWITKGIGQGGTPPAGPF
jgi:hypothetical protein